MLPKCGLRIVQLEGYHQTESLEMEDFSIDLSKFQYIGEKSDARKEVPSRYSISVQVVFSFWPPQSVRDRLAELGCCGALLGQCLGSSPIRGPRSSGAEEQNRNMCDTMGAIAVSSGELVALLRVGSRLGGLVDSVGKMIPAS